MFDIVFTLWAVSFAVYGTYKFIEKIWVRAQVWHWWLEDQRDEFLRGSDETRS